MTGTKSKMHGFYKSIKFNIIITLLIKCFKLKYLCFYMGNKHLNVIVIKLK